jgi:hypothetical protein
MRKEGKSWDEIEKAWTTVSGKVPGKDVLRKREMKLRALAIEWKAGDVSETFFLSVCAQSLDLICHWGSESSNTWNHLYSDYSNIQTNRITLMIHSLICPLQARKLTEWKAKVEKENEAALKKLEADKWNKISEMFKEIGSAYLSTQLQKKWELMIKNGEVDAKGAYVGDDPEVTDDAEDADGAEVSADAHGKTTGEDDAEDGVDESGDVPDEDA